LSLNNDLLRFVNKYTDALEKNDPAEHQLLFNSILPEFSKMLVQKVKAYPFSRHELTLTVYLRLYPFFTEVGNDRDLSLHLRLSTSPVYAATYRRLLKESEPYLFQLITRCLDRLNPPQIVSQILAERSDIPFLDALFKSIKKPLSLELKTNLANLAPPAWISQITSFLKEFDVDAQSGLVLFFQSIPLPPAELQMSLQSIFEHGSGAARVTALSALAAFDSVEIDRFIWDAVGDADPMVQIEALTQLSTRDVPNIPARLVQFADSPQPEVRDTIQKLLPNFRFSRFLQTFDQLDDNQRRRMFNIVRQLDKQTPIELSEMLHTSEPLVRAKAILCIDFCPDVVPQVEDALCDVLATDEMPTLRAKAAELLIAGRSEASRSLLVQAFHRDSHPDVRAAAKNCLENRPTSWKHEE
jgi:hypothetical protein